MNKSVSQKRYAKKGELPSYRQVSQCTKTDICLNT